MRAFQAFEIVQSDRDNGEESLFFSVLCHFRGDFNKVLSFPKHYIRAKKRMGGKSPVIKNAKSSGRPR